MLRVTVHEVRATRITTVMQKAADLKNVSAYAAKEQFFGEWRQTPFSASEDFSILHSPKNWLFSGVCGDIFGSLD